MSNDTVDAKKLSFLTRAALKVQAAKTPATDDEGATTETKIDYKKIAIIGVGATVAVGGAVYAALKLFTGQPLVEEEDSEDIDENSDN